MKLNEEYLNVGKLVNTHGIRGEVKVLSFTDFPDVRFKKGAKLLLFLEGKYNGLPLIVESSRQVKGVYLLRFVDHPNINDVEKYKGADLKVPITEQIPLEDDEYYVRDVIGCEVYTDTEEYLGSVKEVLSPGANDVWVVKQPNSKKEILLPVIQDVILSVDIKNKRIDVHLMEGLI